MQNKSSKTTMPSSSSDSDIEMSIHSNSDLMDIDVIPTDEGMFCNNLQSKCDDESDIMWDEMIQVKKKSHS